MRIDMEKDRKLLGLPPKEPLLPRALKIFLGVLLVTIIASLVGAELRRDRIDSGRANLDLMFAQMLVTADPAEVLRLAGEIRTQAHNNPEEKSLAGRALSYAAEFASDQTLWLNEALFAFQMAREIELAQKKKPQALDPTTGMMISGVLLDLGHERLALDTAEALRASMEREEWQDYTSVYENMLAYIYASAKSPHIRDGKKALELIKRVTEETTDENASNPAYLDTLAESYYAAGQPDQAVLAQRRALAGADTQNLYTFLSHYEKYEKAALAQKNQPAPAKPEAKPALAPAKPAAMPAPAPAKPEAKPASAPTKPAAMPTPAPAKPEVKPAPAKPEAKPVPAKPAAQPAPAVPAKPVAPAAPVATTKPAPQSAPAKPVAVPAKQPAAPVVKTQPVAKPFTPTQNTAPKNPAGK